MAILDCIPCSNITKESRTGLGAGTESLHFFLPHEQCNLPLACFPVLQSLHFGPTDGYLPPRSVCSLWHSCALTSQEMPDLSHLVTRRELNLISYVLITYSVCYRDSGNSYHLGTVLKYNTELSSALFKFFWGTSCQVRIPGFETPVDRSGHLHPYLYRHGCTLQLQRKVLFQMYFSALHFLIQWAESLIDFLRCLVPLEPKVRDNLEEEFRHCNASSVSIKTAADTDPSTMFSKLWVCGLHRRYFKTCLASLLSASIL